MLEEPICCEPQKDTFLAVTEVEPWESKKISKTVKQKKRLAQKIFKCISSDEEEIAFL